jgi:putative ABC transport system permease protein
MSIDPHVFMLKRVWWDWPGYLTIRIKNEHVSETLAAIEKTWKSFTGDQPLQYFFLDQEFEKFYKEEKRTARIAVAFSILAIFIACLGLFGLTSFATEQRAREISLRKVLGSSSPRIVMLFTREVVWLVAYSVLPAWALTYFLMDKWLSNFHYHVQLQIQEFLLSFVIALVIALGTVIYRTYMAAQANPAEILKYE